MLNKDFNQQVFPKKCISLQKKKNRKKNYEPIIWLLVKNDLHLQIFRIWKGFMIWNPEISDFSAIFVLKKSKTFWKLEHNWKNATTNQFLYGSRLLFTLRSIACLKNQQSSCKFFFSQCGNLRILLSFKFLREINFDEFKTARNFLWIFVTLCKVLIRQNWFHVFDWRKNS